MRLPFCTQKAVSLPHGFSQAPHLPRLLLRRDFRPRITRVQWHILIRRGPDIARQPPASRGIRRPLDVARAPRPSGCLRAAARPPGGPCESNDIERNRPKRPCAATLRLPRAGPHRAPRIRMLARVRSTPLSAGPYCAQRTHVPARGRYAPCRAVVRWVASHSPCRSGREYASPRPNAAPLPPDLDENSVLHADSRGPPARLFPGTSSTRSFAEARFSPANYLRANRHSRTVRPRFRATSARTARYRVSSRVAPLGPRVAFWATAKSPRRRAAQNARRPGRDRPPPRPSAPPLPRIWMRIPFCTQIAGGLPHASSQAPHLPGLLPKLDFHPRIICVQIGILVQFGPDSVRHPCSPFCPHRPFAPFR